MDTQGLPHAVAVTTAEVTDCKGALQALRCCKAGLCKIQGVRDILGQAVTVQIAKRSELQKFARSPSAG